MWVWFAGLWAFMSALMISTIYVELVRAVLVHGKVRQDTRFSGGLLGMFMQIEMKKSGWIYFYLAGALYNLLIALVLVAVPDHPAVQSVLRAPQSESSSAVPVYIRIEAISVIALLGIQDTRRFLESVLVTEFGDAKMHVGLLIAGLVHYLGIAPSVLADPMSRTSTADLGLTVHPLFVLVGLLLFIYGSYQQHICNSSLAQQKRANGGKHVVPKGGWFDYVLCPLYSSELVIYLGFSAVCGFTHLMVNIILFWVVLNQSICALYAKQWYHTKFRSEILAKWTIVPGVW